MNMHWTDKPLPWTEERIAQLTKLWTDGKSCSVIAGIMGGGISRNSVIGKVNRLKLPPRLVLAYHHSPRGDRIPPPPRPQSRSNMLKVVRAKRAQPKTKPPEFNPSPEDIAIGAWEPIQGSAPVTFMDLGAGMCRWPIGDAKPYLFCGLKVAEGKSYCPTHQHRSQGVGTVGEKLATKMPGKPQERRMEWQS